jgi:hypothetical protein
MHKQHRRFRNGMQAMTPDHFRDQVTQVAVGSVENAFALRHTRFRKRIREIGARPQHAADAAADVQ